MPLVKDGETPGPSTRTTRRTKMVTKVTDGDDEDAQGMGHRSQNQNELSFLDTEPLDLEAEGDGDCSFLNTEPLTLDDVEEESVDTQEDTTDGDSDVGASRRRAKRTLDSDDSVTSDSQQSDDSLIEIVEIPDMTTASSYEVKRVYTELIDSFQNFEDGVVGNSEKILKHNITASDTMFRKMEASMLDSSEQNESPVVTESLQRRIAGTSAQEMKLAFMHAQMCSKMLKQTVQKMGVGQNPFNLMSFLESLKKDAVDATGQYSPTLAVGKLAAEAASCSFTAPRVLAMYGDSDDFARTGAPEPPPKKVREPRKRECIDSQLIENGTQAETMNRSDEVGDTAEGLAKDVLKSIKRKCRTENKPQSLLDIAEGDDVSETVKRLFATSFLVRDGHVGVSRKENSDNVGGAADLVLKPEMPPAKCNSPGGQEIHRSQTIVSLSASMLKQFIRTKKDSDQSEIQ